MKSGIDYYPLDVILDDKWELIEAEYGLIGFAVIAKLLQKIYGGHGYYIEWTGEVALLFAKRTGLSADALCKIVSACVKRGLFHKDLYEKHSILTSVGIQKRYFEAVSRRKKLELKSDYLLIEISQICKNVDIKQKNVGNNLKNENNFEQSKVKESRGEESRVKESNCFAHYQKYINPTPSPSVLQMLGSFLDDRMTDEAIIAVIDYCRDENKKSWSYIKTVLQRLFADGVRTLEDYQKSREAFLKSKKQDKQSKPTKFSDFEQRKTNYEDIEDDYFANILSRGSPSKLLFDEDGELMRDADGNLMMMDQTSG